MNAKNRSSRALWRVLAAGVVLASSVACNDDCDVGTNSTEGKLSAGLVEQMRAAGSGERIEVGLVSAEGHDMACIEEAVATNGGEVLDITGTQRNIMFAALSPTGIRLVARRRDVDNISANFDDTPPGDE